MLTTNSPSVSWLVVAAVAIFSMYVSTCDSISEAVVVVVLAGALLMVPSVFVLPTDTPCCLFAFLARFAAE